MQDSALPVATHSTYVINANHSADTQLEGITVRRFFMLTSLRLNIFDIFT